MANITFDTILGVTALILSLIGIYYTHKSVRSPFLLEARKKHTEELTKFLKQWIQIFPVVKSATEPKTTSTPSTSIISLNEESWEYKDLIQYHLPNEYKKLPIKWEEYKKSRNEYEMIRYQLYEKMKKEVLAKTDLQYDPDWRHGVSEYFVDYIYRQSFSWIKDGRLHIDRCSTNYNPGKNELWLGGRGLAKGKTEEIDKARGVFEEMMFEKDYLEKYKVDINRIIEKERKLKEVYNKMLDMLEKLSGYPLLPGTKCEMLKKI